MFELVLALCTMFATPEGPKVGCWRQSLPVPVKTREACLDHGYQLIIELANDGIVAIRDPECVKLQEA